MKKYKIAIYLRVSNEDTDSRSNAISESYSITNQRNLLYQFVASQPDLEDATVIEFYDDGYSGTSLERPEMKNMLKLAYAKQIDCVIVKDFSRFARNYLEVSDYVDHIFPTLGIRVISISDNYDSDYLADATNRMDLKLRFIFDAYYPWDISQKVRSGKRTKALNGAYVNSYAPIGYLKDPNDKNKLIIDVASADIVRRIFQLAGLGMSTKEIAFLFNREKVPTPSQIKKRQGYHHKWWEKRYKEIDLWNANIISIIVHDERYLGKIIYYKRHRLGVGGIQSVKSDKSEIIVVENTHDPIITKEAFEKAQNNLPQRKERNAYRLNENLFHNILFCGHCGYALGSDRRSSATSAKKYFCSTVKIRTDQLGCMTGSILENTLSIIILRAIQSYLNVFLENRKVLKKENGSDKVLALQKQLNTFQQAANADELKAQLYDAFVDGKISREQFLSKREKILAEQKQMEFKMEELEKQIINMKQALSIVDEKKCEEYLLTDTLTKLMVEEFVERIDVYSENFVQVKWKFRNGFEGYEIPTEKY